MSKDDVERDLAQLRAEVAALSAARRESAATPTASAPPVTDATASTQTGVAPETGVAGAAQAAEPEHSQLNELLELLEAEIKDLPTITYLIIFTLGILTGRFLR